MDSNKWFARFDGVNLPVTHHDPTLPTHVTAQAIQEALARVAAEGAWRKYEGTYLAGLRSVLSKVLDREHVRLCCSGTFAVELAIRALKLEPDAEVLLAGYDFPGNFRAIQEAGSAVGLFDVALNSWVPAVEQLESAVGPNTRAIIISHLHGALAPMASICEWAEQRGLFVIEDACQAHGAIVDNKPAGAWGDLSVLSFGGSKLIASGRGGAVVTNNAQMAQRMTIFCERGNDAYALSELQAAVILPQYHHLALDHQKRLAAAKDLIAHLSQFEWLSRRPLNRRGQDSTEQDSTEQPAYFKLGLMVCASILSFARVQQCVHKGAGANEAALSAARSFVMRQLFDYEIEIGPGFNGFMRRSTSRCRQPVSLLNSRIAADSTLVLHHSHLLDPQSGGSTVERVKAAFEYAHQEIIR